MAILIGLTVARAAGKARLDHIPSSPLTPPPSPPWPTPQNRDDHSGRGSRQRNSCQVRPNHAYLPVTEPHSVAVDSSILNKRKRSDATSEEENGKEDALSELSDLSPSEDEADNEDGAAKQPAKAPSKRKTKAAPGPKKPRAPKGTATKKTNIKPPGPPKPRKTAGRRGKQAAGADGEFDAERVARDSKISGDNALFSTCLAWLLNWWCG